MEELSPKDVCTSFYSQWRLNIVCIIDARGNSSVADHPAIFSQVKTRSRDTSTGMELMSILAPHVAASRTKYGHSSTSFLFVYSNS